MGLGKTLQALAFLTLPTGEKEGPSLVVCPTSLVYNWLREAARFTPGLKTVAIEGANRKSALAKMSEAGLIVTSYALLRRDIEYYRQMEFATLILDEAQHIKNPETQNAQSATALRARTRFVLTGTPMENSVRDLWSIMNFLMPNYLGSRSDFQERYEKPIGMDLAAPVLKRLGQRMKPFMLRRLKKNVSTELPDKIEHIAYCELNANQKKVYDEVLIRSRAEIDLASQAAGKTQARMVMLTALLRLRQTCCDLRLLGLSDLQEGQTSAKMELLEELATEAIDGGHKMLIFSQFVSMLRLISSRFEALKIPFCFLDGQTKDRSGVVDRFQTDTAIPVFLISLKAGGVGLNLTAADIVIHFDPWWNPAVEAQATDRAHRIGQNNVVTAYKLITRGTVEEKILNLQRRKQSLVTSALESEEPLMSGLTMSDIESLLE